MGKKIIIDADPGIGDAVAIASALFDRRLEVLAVTAVAGSVDAEQATRNVQAIIEQLDPVRWPRTGAASEPDGGRPADGKLLHGGDGLGNSHFEVSTLQNRHPAEKVICDEVRAAPGEVTIVALGPLTNIARAINRDPQVASEIGSLIIAGGAVTHPGNATACAEFNIFSDPASARQVFRAPITKTLVPLDVTEQVILTYDMFDSLPDEETNVGGFLRRILPYAFRSYRQAMGVEGVYLYDAVALTLVTEPELFSCEAMAADVELTGSLTTGQTVFDRRSVPQWRPNMEVARGVAVDSVLDSIISSLRAAAL
ncbi:MAG: nucleoside hydrolase [Pirellulales bacterium]